MPEVYWSNTFTDIKCLIRLAFEYEQVKALQDFESMAIIISKALGGSKDNKPGSSTNVMKPQTVEELEAALRIVTGKG